MLFLFEKCGQERGKVLLIRFQRDAGVGAAVSARGRTGNNRSAGGREVAVKVV